MRLCAPLVATALLLCTAAAAASDQPAQPANAVTQSPAAGAQGKNAGSNAAAVPKKQKQTAQKDAALADDSQAATPVPSKKEKSKDASTDKTADGTAPVPDSGIKKSEGSPNADASDDKAKTAAGGAKELTAAKDQPAADAPVSGSDSTGPVIKIVASHSTLWNATTFVTPAALDIAFVEGDFPTQNTNSSPTSPFIVGVDIKDTRSYQQLLGTGGSITDASSIILQDLKANSPDLYWEILNLASIPRRSGSTRAAWDLTLFVLLLELAVSAI